jgi:hypothetical protein
MKRILSIAVALFGSATVVSAKGTEEILHLNLDEAATQSQERIASGSFARGAGGDADTVNYGDLGADGFSILGDVWDWDNPEEDDPLMGWYSTDVTVQSQAFGRRITEVIWDGHGNPATAPRFGTTGALWIGAFEDEADDLCWVGGLGYGNSWCQRGISPVISLTSSNNVTLNFKYFNDTEADFDYTKIVLRRLPSGTETTLNPFGGLTGKIGLNADPLLPPPGVDYVGQITLGALEGATQFQLVFEMVGDGGWSDEDGFYGTEYGPFGADNVVMAGGASANYTFEASADGWTFQACSGFGSYMGVGNVADYQILDPCGCELVGNVLEFHDDDQRHPSGQHELVRSNPTDLFDMRSNLPAFPTQLQVRAEWDQYSEMPRANGAFYRPGWDYFPSECAVTGEVGWSGRVGQNNFFYNPGPDCAELFNTATSNGVPQSAEQIRFIYELYVSCDAFGITDCTFETNFSPIIDNVQLRGTKVPAAPAVTFAPSATTTRYQDGFAQTLVLNPNGLGRADISYGGVPGDEQPIILGDSLYVTGPTSTTSSMWETRLWFKVRREGPGTKPARYNDWKADVDAVNGNPNPTTGFAYVWMDSVQAANGVAFRNHFQSFCREDNLYPAEGGELTDGNEIIRDDVLVAGTAIDYFVTANYAGTRDENYLLPDTSGGFFFEFEILPSWRLDGGQFKYPCLLYVDATTGAETFIEAAFNELGLEHDRYDYQDATSSWAGTLARGIPPSNNGAPLPQLLGYRGIVLNTGTGLSPMRPADFAMFSDWLNTVSCGGNITRQGMIVNGDNTAFMLENQAPAFLDGIMGATLIQDAYHETGDENYCVQLETPLGGGHEYGTTNSQNPAGYDYDAYGNWCPQQFRFDVLGAVNGGVGNRAYVDLDGGDTNYAQIAREVVGGSNYRVVLDGISYHHLSARDAVEECVGDSSHIVDAIVNELAAGLEWIYGGAANIPSLCIQPCEVGTAPGQPEITEAQVTRLYQNSPNPFNPRTVLRFSLAQTGPVELTIFDVNGRKVRTLVNETREAGLNEVVWDGTDDAGRPVSSGVFWSQLETDDFSSNKKMVVLR